MPFYSRVSYIADGTTTEFTIPFQFLGKSHINVRVNSTVQTQGVNYNVDATTSKVVFETAPASLSSVRIERKTPRGTDEREVVYKSGSDLHEDNLNRSALQLLFIEQETLDALDGGTNPDVIDGDARAAIDTERTVRADADTALAQQVTTFTAKQQGMEARLQTVEGALSGGETNEALAFRVTTLESEVDTSTTTLTSRISDEETARANAVETLANRVMTLESTTQNSDVTALTARIAQEEQTRASAVSALASSVSTVSATANGAKTAADNAVQTANQASASVTNEAWARIDADQRVAAHWGVQLDANGRVVGRIRLDGSQSSSSMDFTTDSIKLSHPSAPNVFFGTLTRAWRDPDTRAFSASSGFSFTHAPSIRLYGPANSLATSYPDKVVNIRNGKLNLVFTTNMTGPDITTQVWQTIYYRKNGTGSYIVLGSRLAHFGQQFTTPRGAEVFSGLSASDYFDFYVAPCDINGNITYTSNVTTYIDVLAFNW